MKTQEELNTLKNEYESLAAKLHELTEDEYEQVTGGENCYIYGPESMIHTATFCESSNEGKINPTSTKAWFATADSNKSN